MAEHQKLTKITMSARPFVYTIGSLLYSVPNVLISMTERAPA